MKKHYASWTEQFDPEVTHGIISSLALSHANEGGEQGNHIAELIVRNDGLKLCDFALDYNLGTVWQLQNCRQALAFYQKAEFLDLGIDREAVAFVKFQETETSCKMTNDIFRAYASGGFNFPPDVDLVFHKAQRKIARVLGEVPSWESLKFRFGPGATTRTQKKNASVVEKLQAGFSCSEGLFPYAARIIQEMPPLVELIGRPSETPPRGCELDENGIPRDWRDVDVVIDHARLNFVPKNAKTYRSICTEPPLNGMVQLAIGDYMSRRLAAFGVDLRDQSLNQDLARVGSLTGELATLDLSSASDTISLELVYSMLPLPWALFLDATRSKTVEYKGSVFKLEKFSSMGNGFTFPLESLIFWALASCASTTGFASVYGDDIIVKRDDVPLVRKVLEVAGFTLNVKKSFWTGPFRESCGGDYLRGLDIRPCYVKENLSNRELFRLHNFYCRNLDTERAEQVVRLIHPALRIYGPDGFGDGHLIGDNWGRPHKSRKSRGYGGVIFDTFKLIGRKDFRQMRPGDRVLSLYSIYMRSSAVSSIDNLADRLDSMLLAPEPMPERRSLADGVVYKTPSLPGTDGYKMISIYTFDNR